MKTMKLLTRLSSEEIEEKRETIVELLGRRAQIEADKKESAREFREALKNIDKQIEGLRAEAAEMHELREVEVDERISGNKVVIFRTDTGEVVSERKVGDSERQARARAPRRPAESASSAGGDDDDGDDEDAAEPPRAPRRGRRQGGGGSDSWDDLASRHGDEDEED